MNLTDMGAYTASDESGEKKNEAEKCGNLDIHMQDSSEWKDLQNDDTPLHDFREEVGPDENLSADKRVSKVENMAAPEIVRNLSDGVPVAIVTGDPDGTGEILDWQQGDNPYNASGNCGLVSVTNVLRMAGVDVDENQITKYALDHHLCDNPLFGNGDARGGTSAEERIEVLKDFGVDATSFDNASTDEIADAVEQGKGVLMAVNAGYLWDDSNYVKNPMGEIQTNHCITITSVARDASTGEVAGFYICDSGRGMQSDSARFVSVDEINKCYTNVPGKSVQITNNPIR